MSTTAASFILLKGGEQKAYHTLPDVYININHIVTISPHSEKPGIFCLGTINSYTYSVYAENFEAIEYAMDNGTPLHLFTFQTPIFILICFL